MSELEEFHRELIADIQGEADVGGIYTTEAFFERMGDILTEAGELDGADYTYFEGAGQNGVAMQVDGYGGDPRDAQGILSLILCDFQVTEEVRRLQSEHLKSRFNRMSVFLRHALREDFREKLEETSSGFMLADLIATTWPNITKIKLVLITNAEKRVKADGLPAGSIDDKLITYSVWDLARIEKFIRSGQTREELVIDFEKDFGGGIPVLRASMGDAALESYVAVIRGSQLGDIYEKWGTRLLEANVRSFLQARGKVNQGIRNTLEDQPEMFFAYNNGITATADAVDIRQTENGPLLVSADNLQVVNGGQTTASIHSARKQRPKKPKARLEEVYVQMKLNVVPSDTADEVIPNISLYANSQNKVSDADLASNHPFQMRLQEFSRRILAPKGYGKYQETRWFYERARGQYPDERTRRTDAERKKFDLEYPRSQYFNKTDLAKFENSWAGLPHVVSQGAQKNFVAFQKEVASEWKKSDKRFDETWFKRMIAKAMIFRHLEKTVPQQPWYQGGYRAKIVTYSMAKLAHDINKIKKFVDLDKVWRLQSVPEPIETAFLLAAEGSHHVIINPPQGVRDMGEWAKKQACWSQVQERKIQYPSELKEYLTTLDEAASVISEERREKAEILEVNTYLFVFERGGPFWRQALEWGMKNKLLTPAESGVLEKCSKIPKVLPSERQCAIAMKALEKLKVNGFIGSDQDEAGDRLI
ncbi:AIPR family protein [Vreelandella malpeensis]|uniref:AIPR family protein n=1 Tax=Vreelandella malpeensis TaxID=1172368 RepID=A0ABS8DT64_9GAMM|nr:AIPR family protein [Halomonas malpeensis]MCB8889463.1 AIPR family protein [Halomonas malpeensis]